MNNLHNFTRGAAMNRAVASLTLDAMRRSAPSIFATQAHASRSERYAYIPTVNIITAMEREGFMPVQASQSNCRTPGQADFTKHMIRFAHRSATDIRVGDACPQVVMINAHNGSSSYKLHAGVFRFVCSNGLIVCDENIDCLTVQHTGDVVDRVIEGSFEVIKNAKAAVARIEDWSAINLAPAEATAFANAALMLRYDDPQKPAPIQAEQVLRARRHEDVATNLWTTFNRVQENLVKGGQRYRAPNGRRNSVREVAGIDQNTALNRSLWRLADEMRAIKAA